MTTAMMTAATVIGTFMLLMWLLSIPLKNVSIVDIGWGLGFVLVPWLALPVTKPSLLDLLVPIWGLRLAAYLAWRNIGKPEDYRYAAMRQRFGPSFTWTSLLIVFGLQGVVMWIVALPLLAASAFNTTTFDITGRTPGLMAAGLSVWLIGFLFESIGDWQLARFKSVPTNHGKVMDRGLWKYTRHPNYFGDFMVWWGHWLICVAVSSFQDIWWTVISPLLMSFLLLKVSGVALLEKSLRQRSPEYEDYIRRTSAFFPRPPRRDPAEAAAE